jgi:hypothetical protein
MQGTEKKNQMKENKNGRGPESKLTKENKNEKNRESKLKKNKKNDE